MSLESRSSAGPSEGLGEADAWSWLRQTRSDVAARGLVRHLDPGTPGLLDLASNDYLALSRHPTVVAGAVEATQAYGVGATGSRLVTGTTDLHLQLEDRLARFLRAESSLVFSSGYLANLGVLTTLAGPGTLVVSDVANHASLIDACRLSRATVRVVPHADVTAVEQALAGHDGRAVVVSDAVFSVDGTLAPLRELHEAARRHGALLLVDEAHGLGVLGPAGRGACALLGLDLEPDIVRTVTLSKALGSQGGAVLGPPELRDHLVDTARAFIFDTGLAPAAVGAALAALPLITDDRVAALRHVGTALAGALGIDHTPGAVVRVVVGDPEGAVAAQASCRAQGVRVGCFRPPSVPVGGSCLRLAARADLSVDEVTRAAAVVREATS
jgi:8-amino-7-oxononanoate synthase